NDHGNWAEAVLSYCGEIPTSETSKTNNTSKESFNFADITAISNTHMVDIKWETLNEVDIDMYVVERSVDGHDYKVVNDQSGTKSNKKSEYIGIDYNPVIGKSYYRVAAITSQGDKIYSYEVEVDFEIFKTKVMVYPNPVRKNQILTADIFVDNLNMGDLDINIFTIDGRLIQSRSKKMNQPQAFEQFKVNTLESGVYILEVKGSDWKRIERFVVR
ncbi:T9SS type A sorting domain-containing protein, partial [Algibacter aquimarinus]|uniref:T9SS type A sorting domain-containing protein n=1 Tax=Algibacter aquimarinus TaxID=1136748 RepID=UPI0031ECCE6C